MWDCLGGSKLGFIQLLKNQTRAYKKAVLASILSVTLSACGGGGSGSTPPPPPPPDTSAPNVTFEQTELTIDSGDSAAVNLSATDNVGVTSGPTVTCTNGGTFDNNTFTAPDVTEETQSVCTASASDAAGNQGTATLTVTIIPPDTEPPVISFSPETLTIDSGSSGSSALTATDNVGVTTGPTVTCSGGTFNNDSFTAPVVSVDTSFTCTATASDEEGNEGTATLTVTVKAPAFSLNGSASKGVIFGGSVTVSDANDPAVVLITGTTSTTDGGFDVDIPDSANFSGSFVEIKVNGGNGAEMMCDAPNGCGTAAFGERFPIDDSFSLSAIIATPAADASQTVYVNVFTDLSATLARARSMTITAASLSDARNDVGGLFGFGASDFTSLASVNITADPISESDSDQLLAAILSGGILEALFENGAEISAAYEAFKTGFGDQNGEIIANESMDDPALISLEDIFNNAAALRPVLTSANINVTTVLDKIDDTVSTIDMAEADLPTTDGQIPPPPNNPPVFTSSQSVTVAEQQSFTYQASTTDEDGDTIAYSLGQSSQELFSIDSMTGLVTALGEFDYESADGIVFDIVINAFDGRDTTEFTVTLTVEDIYELDPTINVSRLSVKEGLIAVGRDFEGQRDSFASFVPDMNGDGISDIIIGRNLDIEIIDSQYGANFTEVYVVYGTTEPFSIDDLSRSSVNLETLSPTQGFVITTNALFTSFGNRIAGIGDVNGDGFGDLFIGEPTNDEIAENAGVAYIIYGSDQPVGMLAEDGRRILNVDDLTPEQGYVVFGQGFLDQIGTAAVPLDDINNDGINDFAISARSSSAGGTFSGEVYIIFGSDSGHGSVVEGRQEFYFENFSSDIGRRIQGVETQGFGSSIANIGDINNDGLSDLGILSRTVDEIGESLPERIFVIYSGFETPILYTDTLTENDGFIIHGVDAQDFLGFWHSLAAAGDVNGDGYGDILMGAPFADRVYSGTGFTTTGAAYLVYGQSAEVINGNPQIDLASLKPTQGFKINNTQYSQGFGGAVAGGFDINGDNIDDLIISDYTDTPPNATGSGIVYIIYGGNLDLSTDELGIPLLDVSTLPSHGLTSIVADNGISVMGHYVMGGQDFNNDGFVDLVISEPSRSESILNSDDVAYVIYGAPRNNTSE